MKKTLITLTVLVMLASVSKGMEAGSGGRYSLAPYIMPYILKMNDIKTYEAEGPFVKIPAIIGGYGFSTAGYVVVFPFALTVAVIPPDNEPSPEKVMRGSDMFFGSFGKALFALPFYIVKKVLWDGPVYLYEAVVGEDEVAKGGVE